MTTNNFFPTPESPTPPLRANEWGAKLPSRDTFFRTSIPSTNRFQPHVERAYLSPSPPPSPSPTVVHNGQSHRLSLVLRTPSPKARPPPLAISTDPLYRPSRIAAPAAKVVPSATTLPSETPIVPSQSGGQQDETKDGRGVKRQPTTLWEKRWMRHPYARPSDAGSVPRDKAPTEQHQPNPELLRDIPYLAHYRANDERLRKIRSSHVISEQRRRESINVGFERLKSLLPFGDYVDGMTKAQILQHAADYIIKLERSIEVLARDED